MDTIGAHFSALRPIGRHLGRGSYAYESARSCLFALLKSLKPRAVYVPTYICEAVTQTVLVAGAEVKPYSIKAGFCIPQNLDIKLGELLLLVDYFGLAAESVSKTLKSLPENSVVVDCSHAYFQKPFRCLATIYSPRKFIPVADGGFIDTSVVLEIDENTDETGSVSRYAYLKDRINAEPEPSRGDYLRAEESLSAPSTRSMSNFSMAIVRSTDCEAIAYRRRANFTILETLLCTLNSLVSFMGDQVPLCYPLQINNSGALRQYLIGKRIFTPKFWPNLSPITQFEAALLEDTVFLPVDHRYNDSHMLYIADTIRTWCGSRCVV